MGSGGAGAAAVFLSSLAFRMTGSDEPFINFRLQWAYFNVAVFSNQQAIHETGTSINFCKHPELLQIVLLRCFYIACPCSYISLSMNDKHVLHVLISNRRKPQSSHKLFYYLMQYFEY
uniref:Putative secreted protein n=1 Tax=Ixodes ricinus TaxID=34613 RepID=A0A6B0UM74_IXORI